MWTFATLRPCCCYRTARNCYTSSNLHFQLPSSRTSGTSLRTCSRCSTQNSRPRMPKTARVRRGLNPMSSVCQSAERRQTSKPPSCRQCMDCPRVRKTTSAPMQVADLTCCMHRICPESACSTCAARTSLHRKSAWTESRSCPQWSPCWRRCSQ